jgi:putative oxidoreductase
MRSLISFSRRLIGLVFLYASCEQLMHYRTLVATFSAYLIVPRGQEGVIAPVVIGTELWLGICLLVGWWLKNALRSALFLQVIFSLSCAIEIVFNSNARCGYSFTVALGRGDLLHLTQDLAMTTLTYLLWRELTSR